MSDTPDTPEPGAGDSADPGFGGGAADGAAAAEAAAEAAVEEAVASISVEDLVADLERVSRERDEYLDGLRRLQAEFENYRKAVSKREIDAKERANDKIVNELLPIIDACDGAVASGAADVEPIRRAIVDNLSRQGLQRLEPAGEAFDPELHEAVMHEPSSDVDVPTVAEVLRVGYGWNGRVLRPAMVKTIG